MSIEKGKIGRYKLLSLIGEGAMGAVYSAMLSGPAGFEKQLAVKIIRENREEQKEQLRTNLINEARIGGMLRHPNIVETYELGEEEGRLFIAMEFIDGITLDRLMKRWRPVPPQACVDIVSQICLGLAHIHSVPEVSLVHCDIKPSNVLIDRYGIVKLADLGLSSSTIYRTANIRGTPGYMAPEQSKGQEVDGRSDIFSVGIVFLEMLFGEMVFSGVNTLQIMSQLQHTEQIYENRFQQRLLKLSPRIEGILYRMLRLDRENRFSSVKEVLKELRSVPKFEGADLFSLLQEGEILQRSQSLAILSQSDSHFDSDGSKMAADVMLNREETLKQIQMLWSAGNRYLCLKGGIGIGKTRLLCALEEELIDEQVLFIDAATLRTEVDLQLAIRTAARMPISSGDSSKNREMALDTLKEWGRWYLLLDNTEGLQPEALEALEHLLTNLPQLRVALASQDKIKSQSVYVVDLPPLTKEQTEKLFVARIEDKGQRYLKAHKRMWSRVLERSCGIPLVVELLAAQYCLAPDVLINLDEIWFDGPLEQAFELSYSRLSKPAQECLAQLALYQSPFSLLEARVLLSSLQGWVGDHLEELLSTSLLQVVPQRFSKEPYFIVPWGMRELVQKHLSHKLILHTQRLFARCLSQWWDNTMLSRFPDYFSFQQAKIERLADFIAAIRYSIRGQDQQLLIGNVLAAAQVYALVGPYSRGISILSRYATRISKDHSLRGHIDLWQGILFRQNGEDTKAKQALKKALVFFGNVGDTEGKYLALSHLIFVETNLGNQPGVERSMTVLDVLPSDVSYSALKHRALGYHHTQKGQYAEAMEHLRTALRIFWSLGDNREVISVLTTLGVLLFRQQHLEAAAKNYRKAIEIAKESDLEEGMESVWMNLAVIDIMFGQVSDAVALFEMAEKRYRLLGNHQALALLKANRALLELLQGAPYNVISLLQESNQLLKGRQYPIASHTYYKVSGLYYLQDGQPTIARQFLKEAFAIVERYSLPYKSADTLALYGEALLQDGDLETFAAVQQALLNQQEDPLYSFWVLFLQSAHHLYNGEITQFADALQHLRHILLSSEYPHRPDLCYQIERLEKMQGERGI